MNNTTVALTIMVVGFVAAIAVYFLLRREYLGEKLGCGILIIIPVIVALISGKIENGVITLIVYVGLVLFLYIPIIEPIFKKLEENDKDKESYSKILKNIKEGDEHYNAKEYETAVSSYKDIGYENFNDEKYENVINANVRYRYGSALFHIKEYFDAERQLKKAIELGCKEIDVYYFIAEIYYSSNDYKKAVEAYSKAIEHGYRNVDVYHSRGIAYYRIEDYSKAIEDLTKTIELGRKNGFVYYSRGKSYSNKGDYDSAIKDYTKAIEVGKLGKDESDVYYYRGVAYSKKKEFDLAINDYKKALNNLGNEDWSNIEPIRFQLANAYYTKKDYDSAVQQFMNASNCNFNRQYSIVYENYNDYYKEITELYAIIINAFLKNEDYDSAIKSLQKGCDFIGYKSVKSKLYNMLAEIYSKKGDEATADRKRALAIQIRE